MSKRGKYEIRGKKDGLTGDSDEDDSIMVRDCQISECRKNTKLQRLYDP